MTDNQNKKSEYNEDLITRHQKSKKGRKKFRFGFLYLFIFVFILALCSLSYLVKYYSPDVDVAIGNKDDMPLNYSDLDYEIKPIDERLKWIQMEDDMPSVSVKKEKDNEYSYLFGTAGNSKELKSNKKSKENELKEKKQPPKPRIEDIKQRNSVPLPLNDSIVSVKKHQTPSEPSVSITKVYLGNYSSLDEAIEAQNSLSSTGLAVSPFVKAVNNHYIVQAGSFYDVQRADDLVSALKAKGFPAKKRTEN